MWRRRRTALNEAVHELRRPLQALALAAPGGPATGVERSVRMAAAALERLDREINGGASPPAIVPLAIGPLLAESVERWTGSGGKRPILRLDDALVTAAIEGDRFLLSQALDNLIVNAIEHGGPRVVVTATLAATTARISVRDCARPLAAPPTRPAAPPLRERLAGRRRRGHGLRVVRRAAAAHGGGFHLHRSAGGAEAVLDLPLAGEARR